MTTHLRARAAQAGALLAVVACGIAVTPAVALASPPNVQITSLSTSVVSGSTVNMEYTVADTNGQQQRVGANVEVQANNNADCQGQFCSHVTQVGTDSRSFQVQLEMPDVAAGQTRNVTIQVTATINGESNSASQQVTVKGPDRPQSVTQVSGKVKDQDGKSVSGASVAMKDSAGNAYSTTTNGSGGYSFNSTNSKPIAPGNISVGALKDGYEPATVTIQASIGRSVNVPLTLKLVAATAAATPSASVSAAASAEALDEATEEPSQDAPATADTEAAAGDSSSSGSLLFIVLGGLLVAAGVGAIVLVMMRRKSAGDDDGPGADDPTAFGGGGGMVPPSHGRFNDATRVAAPMGAGPDATMVASRGGAGSISDAPTMLQRPVPADDEFPDPYGAPIPQQGGAYRGGAAAGGWDDQADGYGGGNQYGGGGTYGEPTQYGRPQNDDGYGGGAYGAGQGSGYGGEQRRYDEPTGMYRPEAADDGYGYDRSAGARGGNYQGGGGYDQGGYDDRYAGGNGYGPQPGGGGTYGGGQQYGGGQYGGGGYDEGRDGYADQGGYDQRGGGQYGRGGAGAAGYDQGGHDDRGGYDQRGAYGGQSRPQEPSHPGQRRSLDWMDN